MYDLALELIEENRRTKAPSLNLGNCGLKDFPTEILKHSWLEDLSFGGKHRTEEFASWADSPRDGPPNRISKIPDLGSLKKLRRLSLAGPKDRGVSPLRSLSGLGNLRSLKALDMSNSQVGSLTTLSGLQLQRIVLAKTRVTDLSPLSGFNKLQSVDCASTKISDLGPLADLLQLRELDCSATQLTHLSELAKLRNLQVLRVSKSGIRDLAPLAKLRKLTKFYGARTEIKNLEPLAEIQSLTYIDISRTRVADLKPLALLSNLALLKCSGTAVSDLAPLSGLSKLALLDLRETKVESLLPLRPLIDAGLEVATEGKEGLIIAQCPLREPPEDVIREGRTAVLRYFDSLDASREVELGDYINCEARLLVIGNSTAGKTHLIHYLEGTKRQRAALKTTNKIPSTHGMELHSWKLPKPIVGQLSADQVEITILDFGGQEYYHNCHSLFFDDRTAYLILWDHDTNETSRQKTQIRATAGGQMDTVSLQHHQLEYWLEAIAHFVRVRSDVIWDVDEMIREYLDPESTGYDSDSKSDENNSYTRLLASRRSFLDLRRELRNHELLSSLSAKGRTEAVDEIIYGAKLKLFDGVAAIAVQNKVDKHGRQHLDMAKLTRKFPFLIDSVSVSVLEGTRMDHLEQNLLPEAFNALGLVGEKYPGHFRKAFKAIADITDLKVPISIVRDEYRKSLPPGFQFDEDKFRDFLRIAGRLGKLLHFPDRSDRIDEIALSDTVFPRPYELLDYIHAILDRELTDRGGIFNLEHARDARVKDEPIGDDASAVLVLMKAFHVIFELDLENSGEKDYVAPQYLTENPKPVRFLRGMFQKPLMRFSYRGFIHASMILEFYSAYGIDVENRTEGRRENPDDLLFWRDGIFIRDENGEEVVLVEFDHKARVINLYPQRELRLNENVKRIAETLKEISRGYSCVQEVSTDGELFIPLDKLIDRARRNIHWFEHRGQQIQLGKFSDFLPPDKIPPMKRVFISYSSRDRAFLEELRSHLRVLERNNQISTWHDRQIVAGADWDGKIRRELREADVILLLLSPDFLNSDYIWDIELDYALSQHEEEAAIVVPILLRSCMWEDTPLSRLQMANLVPEKGKPIDLAPNRDEAWRAVVKGVKDAINPTRPKSAEE